MANKERELEDILDDMVQEHNEYRKGMDMDEFVFRIEKLIIDYKKIQETGFTKQSFPIEQLKSWLKREQNKDRDMESPSYPEKVYALDDVLDKIRKLEELAKEGK